MTINALNKIRRKLTKLRLQPIRVFCLHHVCEHFDATYMNDCDWMQLSVFQKKINKLQDQGYKFISLTEAYQRLKNDRFRINKYVVLTFDDGYKSLKEVLPWLEIQQIPATLFVTGKYLDGISYRENLTEQYLTQSELFALTNPLIEIGHHGWEHTSAHKMNEYEFSISIEKNLEMLSIHPRYIQFWAYTWGNNNDISNTLLKKYNITPVLITGGKNYKFNGFIDRELL